MGSCFSGDYDISYSPLREQPSGDMAINECLLLEELNTYHDRIDRFRNTVRSITINDDINECLLLAEEDINNGNPWRVPFFEQIETIHNSNHSHYQPSLVEHHLDQQQQQHQSNNPHSLSDILNSLYSSITQEGLSKKALDIFLKQRSFLYHTDEWCEDQCCSICITDCMDNESIVKLECKHLFHGETCIRKWLENHSTCPYCRASVNVTTQSL